MRHCHITDVILAYFSFDKPSFVFQFKPVVPYCALQASESSFQQYSIYAGFSPKFAVRERQIKNYFALSIYTYVG